MTALLITLAGGVALWLAETLIDAVHDVADERARGDVS